jgi:hypothetical protein
MRVIPSEASNPSLLWICVLKSPCREQRSLLSDPIEVWLNDFQP